MSSPCSFGVDDDESKPKCEGRDDLDEEEEGRGVEAATGELRPDFLRSRSFLTQSLTNDLTFASLSGVSVSYESVLYVGRFFSLSSKI